MKASLRPPLRGSYLEPAAEPRRKLFDVRDRSFPVFAEKALDVRRRRGIQVGRPDVEDAHAASAQQSEFVHLHDTRKRYSHRPLSSSKRLNAATGGASVHDDERC